jgi:hypothetical protein
LKPFDSQKEFTVKNINELLEKAKWDKLSKSELDEVVKRIMQFKEGDEDDLYGLLYALGRSGASKYRNLVERFLVYPADPMIARIALKTLCTYWDLVPCYLETIKNFIKGVGWDDDQVRIAAISIAGEYVRSENNKECLKLLLEMFVKYKVIYEKDSDNEDDFMCGCIFEAIARGIGVNYDELPPVTDLEIFYKSIIGQSIIQQAYLKLEKL